MPYSKKKIAIIILAVLLTLIFVKRDLIIKYFKEERYYDRLVSMRILKECYNPGGDFEEIFKQEGLDYNSLNKAVIDDSIKKLAIHPHTDSKDTKIPTIMHKIYFTGENKNLPEFYVDSMKHSFTELNKVKQWQNNFWTNKQTVVPKELAQVPSTNIRYIEDEFHDDPLYPTLMNFIELGQIKKPYLAQAADLFRIMLLKKYGGIYSDIDYEIYDIDTLIEMMEEYDFIGGREHHAQLSYYGNSFIAAKLNHPIIDYAIDMLKRNYLKQEELPEYIKYPCNNYDSLYFNGPPLVTVSYFKRNNIDGNNDIILPPWMIYNVSFIRFKYQEGDSQKITHNIFMRKTLMQDQLLKEFLEKPVIIEAHKNDLENSSKQSENIFYSWKNYKDYPIIGADMFSGTWTEGGKTFGKNHHWSWLK